MTLLTHGRHIRHRHVREWWRSRSGTVAFVGILAVTYLVGLSAVMVALP